MALRRARRLAAGLLLLTLIAVGLVPSVAGHEVPNDVLIQAYLKPESQRLRLVVRVPLIALRDMTWPFKAPDILDTSRAGTELHNAATLWLGDEATIYDNGTALPSPQVVALRATLPTDRSFDSWDQALALITGPAPTDADQISIKEGFLDVLFEYPIASADTRLSMQSRWGRLGVQALTRLSLLLSDGGQRVFELHGNPGLVHLDPTPAQVAGRFARAGFNHLTSGADYLLLLVCLVLPFRRGADVLFIAIAAAAASTLTLVASAAGMTPQALWYPAFIATLTAGAVVYLAAENVAGSRADRRARLACALALVLGIACSFALADERQFAGAHPLVAIGAFDAGLLLGQWLTIAVAVGVSALLFRVVVAERIGVIVVSALAAHAAWHWLTQRWSLLAQYQVAAPELTAGVLAATLRWAMIAVAAAGLAWAIGLARSAVSERATGR